MEWIKKVRRKFEKVLSKTCDNVYCASCKRWRKYKYKSGGYCKSDKIARCIINSKIKELFQN